MPSRWQIPLDGPPRPAISPESVHAVVSRWLDGDHKAAVKPYAVSPPQFELGDETRTVLEVRLVDDALAAFLVAHVARDTPVRLGRHCLTVAGAPRLLDGTSWTDLGRPLATGAQQRTTWEVSFRSPTTFRDRSRTSPWPAPESVLTGLAARWRALDPVSAPALSARAMRAVWVSDLDGHSEVLRLRDTVVSGFVGRVRYVYEGPPADAADVDALFGLARYAGIGSHTAFGLGTVDVQHHQGRSLPHFSPTRPAGPAGPARLARPAEPAGPARPAGTAGLAEPARPAGTTGPAGPAEPAEPAGSCSGGHQPEFRGVPRTSQWP
jgi:CRISPR-associated endoribonuclease Cas6